MKGRGTGRDIAKPLPGDGTEELTAVSPSRGASAAPDSHLVAYAPATAPVAVRAPQEPKSKTLPKPTGGRIMKPVQAPAGFPAEQLSEARTSRIEQKDLIEAQHLIQRILRDGVILPLNTEELNRCYDYFEHFSDSKLDENSKNGLIRILTQSVPKTDMDQARRRILFIAARCGHADAVDILTQHPYNFSPWDRTKRGAGQLTALDCVAVRSDLTADDFRSNKRIIQTLKNAVTTALTPEERELELRDFITGRALRLAHNFIPTIVSKPTHFIRNITEMAIDASSETLESFKKYRIDLKIIRGAVSYGTSLLLPTNHNYSPAIYLAYSVATGHELKPKEIEDGLISSRSGNLEDRVYASDICIRVIERDLREGKKIYKNQSRAEEMLGLLRSFARTHAGPQPVVIAAAAEARRASAAPASPTAEEGERRRSSTPTDIIPRGTPGAAPHSSSAASLGVDKSSEPKAPDRA